MPLGRRGPPAELASLFVTQADGGTSCTTGNAFGTSGGLGAI